MGELEDYYVIESVVKYDDDPFKFGRIKCDIPGVIDHNTTMKEAMPWIRPLRMHGYQTFSRPVVGEKVWVLVSKTNYNEFWWTYFHETIDIVQDFLNEYYDNQPDVFHARNTCSCDVMSTFDDERGYYIKIGEDYVNWKLNREMKIAFNQARVMIENNKVYCGHGDNTGEYEEAVKGKHCEQMRTLMGQQFDTLFTCASNSNVPGMAAPFLALKQACTQDILCKNCFVN